MSIILDALKKAQSEKESSGSDDAQLSGNSSGVFKQQAVSGSSKGQSSRTRVIILSLIAVCGLAVLLILKFGGGSSSLISKDAMSTQAVPIQLTPKTASTGQSHNSSATNSKVTGNANRDKVTLLKESAAEKFKSGKFDESIVDYKKLLALLPADPEIYNNYGVSLKKAGKLQEAEKAYATALGLNPEYPQALNNLAVLELANRQYDDARRRLQKAINLDPKYLDAYLHLGLCFEKIGDVRSAMKNYQAFLNISEGKIDRKIRLRIENRMVRLSEEM